jgi:biotin operon repressor
MGILTENDKREVKRLYEEEGLSCGMIAEAYGISRVAIWKQLRSMEVDTRKVGVNINRSVECSYCGGFHIKKRAYWRERKLDRYFCSRDCYIHWVKDNGRHYKPSRYGQRAARRKMVGILGELPDGAVVHHEDGDCLENYEWNLIVFATHSDHMMWHRGNAKAAKIIWPVPIPSWHLGYGKWKAVQ